MESASKDLHELNLDVAADEPGIQAGDALNTEVTKIFKNNDIEVKEWLVQCVAEYEAHNPPSEYHKKELAKDINDKGVRESMVEMKGWKGDL